MTAESYEVEAGTAARWSPSYVREFPKYVDASNIAATAIVAAKVYEAFNWVHYHGGTPYNDAEYHICTAEEIVPLLIRLAEKAMNCDDEVCAGHGELRFVAYAEGEGCDRNVDFFLSIGSSFSDRVRAS